MSSRLSERDREVYRRLADELLPASGKWPAASTAGDSGASPEQILDWRPDLAPDLLRGLSAVRDMPPGEALAWLSAYDAPAYQAFRLTVLGGYYLQPAVRSAMGYPGQENRPVPAGERPDYQTPGLLDAVASRGPIWRSDEASKEKKRMAKHVFLAFTNPVPGREKEFNDWQNNEHLPYGLKNPGFVKATRYKLADAQFAPGGGRAQYLTIWEIESDDIAATLAQATERNKTAVYTDALDFTSVGTVVYSALRKVE
jgi:hypothetical protein